MSYKRTKKLLATVFTSAILAASLCACGNESSSKAVSDNRNVATELTTEAPSEITTEVPTEETTEALEAAFEKDENKENTKKDEKSDKKDDEDGSSLDDSLENGTDTSNNVTDYSVCTTLDKESVENFASTIKDAVLDSDWNTLSNMVSYPIEIDGINVTNSEDFVNLINEKGVSDDFIAAIQAEPCKDLFARDLGVMMGNGEIWYTQLADTDELFITGFNGILSDGKQTQE